VRDNQTSTDLGGSMPHLGSYKAPELIEYGTLKDVTLAVAMNSVNGDGGPAGPSAANKTS
jgi:hypothetical protein